MWIGKSMHGFKTELLLNSYVGSGQKIKSKLVKRKKLLGFMLWIKLTHLQATKDSNPCFSLIRQINIKRTRKLKCRVNSSILQIKGKVSNKCLKELISNLSAITHIISLPKHYEVRNVIKSSDDCCLNLSEWVLWPPVLKSRHFLLQQLSWPSYLPVQEHTCQVTWSKMGIAFKKVLWESKTLQKP